MRGHNKRMQQDTIKMRVATNGEEKRKRKGKRKERRIRNTTGR